MMNGKRNGGMRLRMATNRRLQYDAICGMLWQMHFEKEAIVPFHLEGISEARIRNMMKHVSSGSFVLHQDSD